MAEAIGGVKDASNELRKLVDELHSLAQVLFVLQDHARGDGLLRSAALQRLNDQNGPLSGCALELKTLQRKLEPKPGLRGMVKYLLWPLKEKETLKYIDSIERYKSLFNLALTTDYFALSRTIDGCIVGWLRNKILNWLYFGNFAQKHVEISGRRQKHTTGWIFGTAEFKNWLKDQPDYLMLWGYGIPGAGKTFISSSIIDYLTTQKSGKNLVRQLARQMDHLPETLEQLLRQGGVSPLGCLTFLSLGVNYHNISMGLVQYAAYYLGSHLKNCEKSSTVDILLVFLKKLKALRYRPNISIDRDTASIVDLVCTRDSTPLQSACILGKFRLLEEVPSTISVIGFKALLAASSAGHEEIIDLLTANGADIPFRISNGTNVLHIAVRQYSAIYNEMVKLLRSLVGLVIRRGYIELVFVILKHSPDILYRDALNFPPVHYMVIMGNLEAVLLLLEEGWDVDFKGPEGRTALHFAASIGSSEMVELLLQKGASLSLYDDDEDTPLDKAIRSNCQEVIIQMINSGADVTTINANGRSSLDLAISEGSSEIVRLLTEKNAIPST
ncbi:uncharacterized protein H6S33_002828 [Morchella sextelata]|uniref:uncharacterized protein n=1 Tax=Morchella sextelata TaxID=1174677 RepID=UPI001D037A91|nr:uncharacterized protein H6S33_002828 [Morchella sextelata]KAH0607794.1 hypothetical protein H6S33_002828 [Morchella sextelata]